MHGTVAEEVIVAGTSPPRNWLGCGAVVGLVVLIAIGLLLPMRRCAREAARRSSCANNLRHISLALMQYAELHGTFPPPYITDSAGKPLHSWRTLILPYLEEKQLYDSIDLTKPWDDPANAKALNAMPNVFTCPSAVKDAGRTTYVVVVSDAGFFRRQGPVAFSDLISADRKTLLVTEVPATWAVPWMAPVDIDAEAFLQIGRGDANAPSHAGGITLAAFVDGSVRTLVLGDGGSLSEEGKRALITATEDFPPGEQELFP